MLPIVVRRSGYNDPITIRAEGLPEGVTLCPTVVAAGQKGINVCLKSTDAAKPGVLNNLKIIGEANIGGKPVRQIADLTVALQSKTNQMPYPPEALLNDLALGVSPAAPFSLRTEPAEITFGPDLTAKFKVIANRQKDYTEPITVAVANINDGGPKPVPGLPAERGGRAQTDPQRSAGNRNHPHRQ